MILDMLEYYEMVKGKNIHVIYSGPIWADGIEGTAGVIRRRMEYDNMPFSASQAVFSIFIEQMNNMLMHSAEADVPAGGEASSARGTFVLAADDKKYYIQTGNLVEDSKAGYIREKIEFLNSLDKNELRQYYKQQIKRENQNPDSKGAGLGLIEIARRANSKIEYEITPYKDECSFFSLCVSV